MNKQYLIIMLALIMLSGCETVKGVGQDVENTGDNIQEVVEEVAQPEQPAE